MCMFSREVRNVADTRMFGRLIDGSEQVLVYQMALQAGEDLAMVLPLPVPPDAGENAIRFINLERAPHFFNDLGNEVPVWKDERRVVRDYESLSAHEPARATLAVRTVGRYEASFVPSLADFIRLDARFRLPDAIWSQVSVYRDWGFAVFKLRETGSTAGEAVHPMAMRFPTRYHWSLFFPTVHVHDGELHETAWFDHLIYFQDYIGRKWGSLWFHDAQQIAETAVPQWPEKVQYERSFYRVADAFGKILPEEARYGRVRWGATADVSKELRKGSGEVLDAEMPVHGFGLSGTLKNRDTWFHMDTL
jgi:hypothetical protein